MNLVIFLFLCSVVVLLGLHHSYKKHEKEIQEAEKKSFTYTNKEWTIVRRYLFWDCSLVLVLRDVTESECSILYPRIHPDYQILVILPIGSKIHFLPKKNLLSEPTEPSAYVTTRSLYSPHDTAFHA